MALKAMENRRTIRKYTDEPVTEDQLRDLLLAAMYAPSAWGKRSWEFIAVDDPDTRKELGNATPYASQAAQAPIDIVIVANKNVSSAWVEDASVAAEHINLEAAKLGLGSSWVQIRGMHHDAVEAEQYVRNLLGIPEDFGICCIITVGHPAEQKSPHREGEFMSEKVHLNKFGKGEEAA
ncbi:MAG: nitroreductase family protein [Candidatus Aquicultor sp.]